MMQRMETYRTFQDPEQGAGKASLVANEDGSVIILALIMLMLLTMVGTSATNTSSIEIRVAGNERNYKQNFFMTETAALQGAQEIQNANSHTESWMRDETFLHTNAGRSVRFDKTINDVPTNKLEYWKDLETLNGARYADTYNLVVYTGIAPWSSLDMTAPTQVRAFSVYGRLRDVTDNQSMIIETGFAKRM